jgi:hypothetical protein
MYLPYSNYMLIEVSDAAATTEHMMVVGKGL